MRLLNGGFMAHLTDNQRKALLWLVPGQTCGDAPRNVSAALNSLRLYHPELVTSELKETPRGRRFLGYELTEAGASERAAQLDPR
jgi:hypothetical protein